MINPHYYLMKNKKILRLEGDMDFSSLPQNIQDRLLDSQDNAVLDQNQANWRVVIFRDEIMDLDEYTEWLSGPEASDEENTDCDLIAN